MSITLFYLNIIILIMLNYGIHCFLNVNLQTQLFTFRPACSLLDPSV